jgi:hypothetical protein
MPSPGAGGLGSLELGAKFADGGENSGGENLIATLHNGDAVIYVRC